MLPNSKPLFFATFLSAGLATGLLVSPVLACGERPTDINALHEAHEEIKMLKLAAAEGEGNRPARPEGGAPRGMPPGFEEAAAKLGVSADTLFQTMSKAGGPRADLAKVAKQLGVSKAALKEALPPPPPPRQ